MSGVLDDAADPGLTPLVDAYGEQARTAVDAYEVAVLLEADGVDDAAARSEYGAVDVFDLARRLCAHVGEASPAAPPPRKDWYPSTGVAVVRGWTFTIAGLMTMTAVGLGAGTDAVSVVLVANIVGIALLQAVAFLGYLAMERAGPTAGAAALHPLLGVLAAPVVVGAATALAVDPPAGLMVGVALGYLTAMVLLLVLQRVALVASVVLPVGALAVVHSMEVGWPPSGVVVGAWLVGLVVLLAACFVVTRSGGRRTASQLRAVDVRAGLPYVVSGLGVGLVVLGGVALVARLPLLDGASSRTWLLAALPFLVPVSLAEVMVVELRRSLHLATARTEDVGPFRRRALSLTVVLWLASATVTLVAAVGALLLLGPGPDDGATLVVATFGLLAALLTAGLLLLAAEGVRRVIAVLWGATLVLVGLGLTDWPVVDQARWCVAVLAVAVAWGAVLASRAVARPGSYR